MERFTELFREPRNPRYYLKVTVESSRTQRGRYVVFFGGSKAHVISTITRKQLNGIAEFFRDAYERAQRDSGTPEVSGLRHRALGNDSGAYKAPGQEAPGLDGVPQPTHTAVIRNRKTGQEQEITYRADGWAVNRGLPDDADLQQDRLQRASHDVS
jgi:hypothetical protein